MKFKKLLQGMFFAAAFAATFAITGVVDASAAASVNYPASGTKIGTVSIDMSTQTLNFKPNAKTSASELLVGIGTATKTKVTAEDGKKVSKDAVKVAAWDVYDITTANNIPVDLSKLNNAKDNYIEIKTDNNDTPLLIKIPAVAASNVVTYDASKNELNFKAGAKKAETGVASYEYRTAYSTWRPGEEIGTDSDDKPTGVATGVFSDFQYQGATIYVRTPGTTTDNGKLSADSTEIYDAVEGKQLTSVYVSDSLPGKEVKLTIAKKANGPKVTLDYVNATVTTPKGTEWRLVAKADANPNTPAPSPEKGYAKEPVATFLADKDGEVEDGATGTLEVRTSATPNEKAPAKSKAASNWTRVAIQTPGTLDPNNEGWISTKDGLKANTTDKEIEDAEGNGTGVMEYGGAGITKSFIYGANADGDLDKTNVIVKAEYTQDKKKVWNGVKLTNTGADIYQVVVVPAGTKTEDVDTVLGTAKNIKTLKAATAKADGTLALTGVADGSTIYIRKAGNAKTTTWVGKFEAFGLVDFLKTRKSE